MDTITGIVTTTATKANLPMKAARPARPRSTNKDENKETKTMKHAKTALSILAVAAAIGAFATGSADARKLFASRTQVLAACNANDGWGWGYNGVGDYGCLTNGGWIYCKENGSCEGGRGSEPSRRVSRPSSSLPPARN